MTIDHDAIAARVRQDNTLGLNICAAYLDLYDEVKRLRAERDAGKRTVPAGQTPLDDKLNHRFLDIIREGKAARDAGTASPYHGHSLEHCLHATGWVSRDLRLALNESRSRAEKAEAERDALRAALSPFAKAGELFSGDPGTVEFDQCIYSPAAGSEYALCGDDLRRARQALKGQTNE